jgi:hypothetical protein
MGEEVSHVQQFSVVIVRANECNYQGKQTRKSKDIPSPFLPKG